MRIARTLVLLAGLALAALALTASTAFAQETEVEVVEVGPQGHEPCNPCPVHATGEATITDSMGNPLSTCEDEFTGIIFANGNGEIEWNGGTAHGAPGCNAQNCDPPANHWTLRDPGELGNGEEHLWVDFCLSGIPCTAEVHIDDPGVHNYVLSLVNAPCPGPTFITGSWQLEEDELEFVHHDD